MGGKGGGLLGRGGRGGGVPAFAHELITGLFWGVISGKKNPPEGLPETTPGFRKPRFRFLFFLDIFSNKYVGERSKNK